MEVVDVADRGVRQVLLTTALMAPEAHALDAVLGWFSTGSRQATAEAAAQAYDRFQRCGIKAARRLFAAER